MSVYKNNVKNLNRTKDVLRCKCGSNRYNIKVYEDEDGARTWIDIECRACGNTLYYNGA